MIWCPASTSALPDIRPPTGPLESPDDPFLGVVLLLQAVENKKAIQTAFKLLYLRVRAPYGRPHHTLIPFNSFSLIISQPSLR